MMMMVRRRMMMMVTIPVLPAASFTFMRTISEAPPSAMR